MLLFFLILFIMWRGADKAFCEPNSLNSTVTSPEIFVFKSFWVSFASLTNQRISIISACLVRSGAMSTLLHFHDVNYPKHWTVCGWIKQRTAAQGEEKTKNVQYALLCFACFYWGWTKAGFMCAYLRLVGLVPMQSLLSKVTEDWTNTHCAYSIQRL